MEVCVLGCTGDATCFLTGSNLQAGIRQLGEIQYLWCGCHIIHLVTKTVNNIQKFEVLVGLLKKMSKYLSKSIMSWSDLKDCLIEANIQNITAVPKETPVRWMSLYDLVATICRYEAGVKMYNKKYPGFDIDNTDWKHLFDIQELLFVFTETTLYLERAGVFSVLQCKM